MSRTAFCGLFLLLNGVAGPSFAWVQSVSLERTFVGKNIRVLEVEVNCNFNNHGRKLRKVVSDNKPWCSVDLPSVCANRKVVLARKICSYSPSEFDNLVAARGARSGLSKVNAQSKEPAANTSSAINLFAKADTADDLLQEKMLIEEQRIKIEQQRLELRKREIALKKELAELATP